MFGRAFAFSQDIAPWCVALISSEPSDNTGTDPSWGEACTSYTTGADGNECQNGGVAFGAFPVSSSATVEGSCRCSCLCVLTAARAHAPARRDEVVNLLGLRPQNV